jgi:hypothetical protein
MSEMTPEKLREAAQGPLGTGLHLMLCATEAASAWATDRAYIETLETIRQAAQGVANTWRVAEDQPYVTENEAEMALVAALAAKEPR